MNLQAEIVSIYERLGKVVEIMNAKPQAHAGGHVMDKKKPFVGKEGYYGVEFIIQKLFSGKFARLGDPSEEFRSEWAKDKEQMKKDGWGFMEWGFGADRGWKAVKWGKGKEN